MVCVNLANHDRFSLQNQQIALRRINLIVQHHWNVKTTSPASKACPSEKRRPCRSFQNVAETVGGNGPGFGQRRLRLLGLPIDVDQVRHHRWSTSRDAFIPCNRWI